MGFDHVVANMFFLPTAIFAHVPGLGWGDALHNWLFAFLGNLAGASIFVAGGYWYLYARPTSLADRGAGDTERTGAAHDGGGDGRARTGAVSSGGGSTTA